MEWLGYLSLGLFAGTIAGLLGVGGGLVIVPFVAYQLEQNPATQHYAMHLAVGTSLATIMVTSLSSIYAHHKYRAIHWEVVATLAPGLMLGALAGALTAAMLPTTYLKTVFGLFELLVAVSMFTGVKPSARTQLPGTAGLLAVGLFIGVVSALLGIGGGTLSVFYLMWCNIRMHRAVATSAACGLPIALTGSFAYLLMGGNGGLAAATGFVYWPAFVSIAAASVIAAPLGAKLAHWLPVRVLLRIFAVFLASLGLWLLAQ